jgi:hypothetical protein
MSTFEVILTIEVGVIALGYLIGLFRGPRP